MAQDTNGGTESHIPVYSIDAVVIVRFSKAAGK